MTPILTIVEVLRRADQGITRPFLCRADDGLLYYVKGKGTGRRSLCCEWVASNLARDFGLPVPAFAIAQVPRLLVSESTRADIHALGSGLVFASAALENSREITWAEAAACPEDLKARILLFDWWVRNEDRSLAEDGGNPNLLVTPGTPVQVWVFDFNLAFDQQLTPESFWSGHLFAQMLPAWPAGFREAMMPKLEQGRQRIPSLMRALPPEWLDADADETLLADLSEPEVSAVLARAFEPTDQFWSRT